MLRVLSGSNAGTVLRVGDQPIVVGRYRACGLRITGSGVSRQHARIERDVDDNVVILDLNSTNGTYVDGEKIEKRVLVGGERLSFGLKTEVEFLHSDESEVRGLVTAAPAPEYPDAATTLTNDAYVLERLRGALGRALRVGEPVTLMMIELDSAPASFDAQSAQLARGKVMEAAKGALRANDLVAPYGSDYRFAAILSGTTGEVSLAAGERIRESIEVSSDSIGTVSIGLSAYSADDLLELKDFLSEVEANLEAAKSAGGNRCVMQDSFLQSPEDTGH